MKDELREIQKKVRLAAEKQRLEEEQKKQAIKETSEKYVLEEKKKLEEEIKKKDIDYSLFFLTPLALLALLFAIYTLVEIYRMTHQSVEPWKTPKINSNEIQTVKNELNNILLHVKKEKNINSFIKPGIPEPWQKKIINELCADNSRWQIASIEQDKLKKGNNPLLKCILESENGKSLSLFVIKDGEKIYLYKTEQITEQINGNKK